MVTIKFADIDAEINELLAKHDFPAHVVEDVNKRLSDCQEPAYAAQQLRYLQNVISAGKAPKK